ncbi:MAG TPA: hypothetical protein VM187_10920 [Niastella sp.]|nr:hypothetical protein [Niastella sp.]
MKRYTPYIFGLMLLSLAYCKSPMPVTFNPDDHTNANGTPMSAKSTTQLPSKNNNVPMKLDTIKMPNDAPRPKQ